MTKLVASASVILGLVTSLLTLASAFGLHITPDQHTAIQGVIAAALTVLGLWFHPDVPVGTTEEKP